MLGKDGHTWKRQNLRIALDHVGLRRAQRSATFTSFCLPGLKNGKIGFHASFWGMGRGPHERRLDQREASGLQPLDDLICSVVVAGDIQSRAAIVLAMVRP